MTTVAFPLSAFAMTIFALHFKAVRARFSSLEMLPRAGGGFAFLRMLQTAARALLAWTSSRWFRKAGSTPAMMSLTGTRFGAGAKFRPRSRTAFSESLSLCEERRPGQSWSKRRLWQKVCWCWVRGIGIIISQQERTCSFNIIYCKHIIYYNIQQTYHVI